MVSANFLQATGHLQGESTERYTPLSLASPEFAEAVEKNAFNVTQLEQAPPHRIGRPKFTVGDSKSYGRRYLEDDSGTSHYSIIDKEGNAVAATETINLTFGSLVVPPGTGVVLNDELDDFTIRTGVPNAFGLMMSERNFLH